MFRTLALVLLFVLGMTSIAAQDESEIDPDFAPEMTALAQQSVTDLNNGDYQAVFDRFSADVAAALPVEQVQSTWETLNSQAGAYQEELAITTQTPPAEQVPAGSITVILTAQFEAAVIDLSFTFNPDAEIIGFFIAPGQAPASDELPAYADAAAFTETEVTVDADTDFPLPGTLALPVGDGPFPAVILLGGSGPTDQDGTIGPNTPLRDIAQGLATQGIAVLRYDKRTTVPAYAQQMMALPDTAGLQFEYIDDTLAAIMLLQETDSIDADRIYIAGHSLGGTAAPRVAAQAESDVAGLIILAGSAAPLHEAVLRQVTYLSELDGEISDDEQAQIDQIALAVARINGTTDDVIAADTNLLGAPFSYWADVNSNPPAELAAELDLPLLILQGEGDYQVTVEDDLSLWRDAVGEREDVRIITYAGLGHIFTPASDPATPADYQVPADVDGAVIDDIAAWINGE